MAEEYMEKIIEAFQGKNLDEKALYQFEFYRNELGSDTKCLLEKAKNLHPRLMGTSLIKTEEVDSLFLDPKRHIEYVELLEKTVRNLKEYSKVLNEFHLHFSAEWLKDSVYVNFKRWVERDKSKNDYVEAVKIGKRDLKAVIEESNRYENFMKENWPEDFEKKLPEGSLKGRIEKILIEVEKIQFQQLPKVSEIMAEHIDAPGLVKKEEDKLRNL